MVDLINDEILDESFFSPVCSYCVHIDTDKIRACKAFPKEKSIPESIWTGKNKHTKTVKGDNGILFQKRQA